MERFFRSGNLASRVFDRQLLTPRPGATVNTVRRLYENLVPSYTIYDIDCPDYSFRKFTDDGKYLVAFSRNHQDLIVYRPIWLTYSCNEECDSHDVPPKAKKFDSFFKELYSMPLASSNEYICKDFFLYMECHQFGLFATSTAQSNDLSVTEGAIHGVPSIEKINFYLVRLEDGVILDEKAFCNDFINLAHSIGAYLYEDLLCIVSLRYQTIHILQIRDSGNLVEVRKIGAFCREDDELFLHSHVQPSLGGSFLPGIKQRLLSYIFRRTWSEVSDQTLRVQHLKKRFYFHFQDYVDLIIWKVQFLDRHHLFIKFGSVDGGVSRSTDQNLAFFAVYNMETTDIISLYQNSSEELYSLFEHFYDHFHANPQNSSHGKFISSHSNDAHALDQLRIIKNKANSSTQFVKKMMASVPYTCQSQSPSPYFDLSLFRYDEKSIHSRTKWWKLKEEAAKTFKERVLKEGPWHEGGDANSTWMKMVTCIRKVASEEFGVTKGGKRETKETWWWNEKVQKAIKEKKECFTCMHLDRSVDNVERYKVAKKTAKRAVGEARGQMYVGLYQRLGTKEGEKDIYRMAKSQERKTRDIIQVKCIKDATERLLTKNEDIKNRWQEYFEKFFNEDSGSSSIELDISSDDLNRQFVCRIQESEVKDALKRLKGGKAMGPDGIPIEVWRSLIVWLTKLFNLIFRSNKMPNEWRQSILVPIFKNKGTRKVILIIGGSN